MSQKLHPFNLQTVTQKIAQLCTDHPEAIPAVEAGLDLAETHHESRTA